ncbi:hypothetical protein T484DRAFT_1862048 [Baffinella frigidus]|nr:hypothetical protein T484DRAFT_1862048 [Cryptophyta sp. CCMP2293]
MSSDQHKNLAHLCSYDGGKDFGTFRANMLVNATSKQDWQFLLTKQPIFRSQAHSDVCHDAAAMQRTAALLRHPIKNATGEVNSNPSDAQTKIHNDALMQHWQNELAEFIESKLTGDPLTLVQNISTTDPERGSTALTRLDAVYGHLATRDDNTDQEELLKKAVVGLHALMIQAATTWAIVPLITVLEAFYLASVSLGITGELHDKSTLLMTKMILEQCPDTRHTVAFAADTFDLKYKTIPILLADMRQHARRAPDRASAGLASYAAALAITAPPNSRFTTTPRNPAELVQCRQCEKMLPSALLHQHLYDKHLDALRPNFQATLTARFGKTGAKPPAKNSRGAGKILSLTSSAGQSVSGGTQVYGATGAEFIIWEGEQIFLNSGRNLQNNEINKAISLCVCV